MTTPMTRDELVELMARDMEKTLAYEIERDVLACDLTREEQCKVAQAALRALEAAGCQIVQGEPVGYQRRYLYEPGAPGSFALWEQCSKEEASGHFEKMAGHEYRAIFAGKVQP